MRWPVILAIVLALGAETTEHVVPMSFDEIGTGLLETGLAIGSVWLASLVFVHVTIRRFRSAQNPAWVRRRLALGARLLDGLLLLAYGFILYGIHWPDVVRIGLGLQDAILVDEILILLPYLVGYILVLVALYPATQLVRSWNGRPESSRRMLAHIVSSSRQSMGLILPIAFAFPLGQDVANRFWPNWSDHPFGQFAIIGVIGFLVIVISPGLVRLAWSTTRLPAGPTREQLERLAKRNRFRYSDILIWHTESTIANAGVTGILPWFRYVLLTDRLLDGLTEEEILAVFGHEMGHVAHRHLAFFGIFFLTGLILLALGAAAVDGNQFALSTTHWGVGASVSWTQLVLSGVGLLVLGASSLFAFGNLSRTFEREADLYGCRAVSCGRTECPPHLSTYGNVLEAISAKHVCPVGINLFIRSLLRVSIINGVSTQSNSWRHGSIARRIAFLEGLEHHPGTEDAFRKLMMAIRFSVAMALVIVVLAAIVSGFLGLR